MTIELKINDNIPNFTLPLSDDSLFNSEELKKKLYIIYFYPKDNTPGCTNEAKDFSSLKKDFDEIDAEIIGISKDSIKKHKNFIEKQLLKIKLASDEEGNVIESFGVWVEKKMYGRTYMGIERSTFIVSSEKKILEIYRSIYDQGVEPKIFLNDFFALSSCFVLGGFIVVHLAVEPSFFKDNPINFWSWNFEAINIIYYVYPVYFLNEKNSIWPL